MPLLWAWLSSPLLFLVGVLACWGCASFMFKLRTVLQYVRQRFAPTVCGLSRSPKCTVPLLARLRLARVCQCFAFAGSSEVAAMSYKPTRVANALKSMLDQPSASVTAAVKARLAAVPTILLTDLLTMLLDCGMTPDQVLELREALDDAPPAAASPVAAGAPVTVRASSRCLIKFDHQ